MCRICIQYGVSIDSKYKRSQSDGFRRHICFGKNRVSRVHLNQLIDLCFPKLAEKTNVLYPLYFSNLKALIIFENGTSSSWQAWVEDWKCPPQPETPLGDSVGSLGDPKYNWSHERREEKKLQDTLSQWMGEWYNRNKHRLDPSRKEDPEDPSDPEDPQECPECGCSEIEFGRARDLTNSQNRSGAWVHCCANPQCRHVFAWTL
jgi:hypothetical protein